MERTDEWVHGTVADSLDWIQKKYWNGHERWRRNITLDRGDHWSVHRYPLPVDPETQKLIPLQDSGLDLIAVNLVGSYNRLLLNYLTYRNLKSVLKPTKPDDVMNMDLLTLAANSEWRRRMFEVDYNAAILDGIVTGDGWYRVDWNTEIAKDKKKRIIEPRDIFQDSPSGRRVSPFMICWDYNSPTKRMDAGEWALEFSYRPKWWLIENEALNNKKLRAAMSKGNDPSAMPTAMKTGDPFFGLEAGSETMAEGLCLTYEWWHKPTRLRKIYVLGMEDPIDIRTPAMWDRSISRGGYLLEYPWINFRFIDLINEWGGLGLPVWIDDLQMEFNRSRTMMFDRRKREVGGQVQVNEKTDVEEIRRYLKGEKVIKKRAEDAQGFTPIINAPIPADEYRLLAAIKQDMEELTRLSGILRGQSPGNRVSATEFQGLSSFAQTGGVNTFVRKADIFASAIVRHLARHIQYGYTKGKFERVAGPMADYWIDELNTIDMGDGTHFVELNEKYLHGDFDIEVESTSAPVMDAVQTYQQFRDWFTIAIQLGQMAVGTGADLENMGGINVFEGLRKLGELQGHKDLARIIKRFELVEQPIKEVASFQIGASSPLSQTNSTNSSQAISALSGGGSQNAQQGTMEEMNS